MNISPITIYLWQLADNLRDTTFVFGVLAVIAAIIGLIYFTFTRCEPSRDPKDQKRHLMCSFRLLLFGVLSSTFFMSLSTFTPESKTVAMMVVIPEIAHSKVIQQDLPDIYNAAVEALKSAIKKP